MITIGEFIEVIQREADLADVDVLGAELIGIGSSVTEKNNSYSVNLRLADGLRYTINVPKDEDIMRRRLEAWQK